MLKKSSSFNRQKLNNIRDQFLIVSKGNFKDFVKKTSGIYETIEEFKACYKGMKKAQIPS